MTSSLVNAVPYAQGRLPRFGRVTLSMVVALIVAFFAAVQPDLMMIERVRFEGNERASVSSLRHFADLRNGSTLWGVDLEHVQRGVQQHPWIKSSTVRREFPSTLVIQVEEYHPVGLIQWQGLRYVDRDGSVFLKARTDDLDYPVITGITPELERLHPQLPKLAIRDALSLMDRLDRIVGLSPAEISEVAFSRSRGFTVITRVGGEILFGLSDLDKQVRRLAVLQQDVISLSVAQHIDLGPKTVAIVRPIGPVHVDEL